MGRAEVGTPKYIDNRSKARGLTKLNFYCQICQKANRDEHGFRLHCQSESHVRRVQLMGSETKQAIQDFSQQLLTDFLRLLKTAHGDKSVVLNHFYQEYIQDRHHIHMNSTKWHSLTDFGCWLGKEGLCRVEDVEGKGLHVAYIDNSPEALKRRDDLKRREALQQGDKETEEKMIREQIKRAQEQAEQRSAKRKADDLDQDGEEARELKRVAGEKITLSFGQKKTGENAAEGNPEKPPLKSPDPNTEPAAPSPPPPSQVPTPKPNDFAAISLKKGSKPQARNVFADAEEEEEAAGGPRLIKQEKKVSVAERIMREEQDQQKRRSRGPPANGTAGGGFSFSMSAARKK